MKDESHISGLNNANDQSGKSRQKPRDEGTCGGGGSRDRKQAIIGRERSLVWIFLLESKYESSK